MKKVFSILMVFLLVFGLVSCGGESPEQAVKNTFDAIKQNDSETASKYINYDDFLKAGKTNKEDDAETDEMIKLILGHFDYKIISSSQQGDEATVQAEITNIDMKTIMGDFVSEALVLAFSGLDEETMEAQMKDKFSDLINREDNQTLTKTVEIKLAKSGSSWKIDMSDETADAIFGGMLSVAEDLNASFGGDSN
jgi:predicted small lipoprotein YifL